MSTDISDLERIVRSGTAVVRYDSEADEITVSVPSRGLEGRGSTLTDAFRDLVSKAEN